MSHNSGGVTNLGKKSVSQSKESSLDYDECGVGGLNHTPRLVKPLITLLEILSYATTMFATRMQLSVACNYVGFFMQLKWIFAPFLGVYATMVQL
jgi:hypothetical protein